METYLLFDARDQDVMCSDAYIHCSHQYIAGFYNSKLGLQNDTADQWTLEYFLRICLLMFYWHYMNQHFLDGIFRFILTF